MKPRNFILAETLGTFVLLFSVGVANYYFAEDPIRKALTIALGLGLMITNGVLHAGTGHINPAVTMGALAFGKINKVQAVTIIISQLLAAVAGSKVFALSLEKLTGEVVSIPLPVVTGMEPIYGAVIGFATTFFLVSLALIADKIGGAGVGGWVFFVSIIPLLSGAGLLMNPAIWAGLASLNPSSVDPLQGLFVQIFAPLLGGVAAGLAWKK